MTEHSSRGRQGFTLAEVMTASGLIAISILGIGLLHGMVIRMNRMTEEMVGATAASQAKIEEISAQDSGARTSGTDTFEGYNRSWTLASGISTGTTALTVISSWDDIGGNAHQMTLSSIVAD